MFTKYASLENVQVLELRSTPDKVRHASLGKMADFGQYRTDDGYLYARVRAISSRVNKNHDGWPAIELAGDKSLLDQHLSSTDGFTVTADHSRDYGFNTFLGKPIFVDHHNSNPNKARGVIVDAKLHVDDHKTSSADPYYSSADVDPEHLPGTWVELMLEVDAKSFPKFAKAIVEGARNPRKGIDGWSMGCDVEKSVCSICKNSAASPEDYCHHIKMKGAYFDAKDAHGRRTARKAYENCYGVKFFELSGVFDPADETALSLEHARTSKSQEDTITQDPKEKGLKDAADEQAEELLDESGKKHEKLEKKGGPPPLPGTALECPNCAGDGIDSYDRPCAMCGGRGSFRPQHPGGDGVMSAPVTQGYNDAEVDPAQFGPVHQGKTAGDNPLPQSELSHAPEHVDTLREEEVCPVCGSSMDGDTCDVCPYQAPPEGFGNPDLTKAQDVDVPTEPQNDARLDAPGVDQTETAPPPTPKATNTPSNPAMVAHVTSDMEWDVHKTSARINKTEQPIVATHQPQTNEPQEKILADQLKPITSRVRTAEDFIAAVTNKENNHMDRKVADSAPPSNEPRNKGHHPMDDVRSPEKVVDVLGVGGVIDPSNESAGKANAQVDVLGIGGTGVESVASDQEGVNVEQGTEHSKNIEAIPTDTWGPNEGDSLGQQAPVTREPFPASEDGVRAVSHWVVEGHDDGPFPPDDIGGGTAVQGVKPIAEQFGDRVNVLEHTTSPGNNSGPTKTWTGTEGNGVLKQQDPVTNESIALGESEMESAPNWTSSTHIFAAFKLADLEVDLGLIPAEKKYERAAELERETPQVVNASLKYAQRVKTAAGHKTAGVQKLPVMGRPMNMTKEASPEVTPREDDSFMFGGV